jgi:hypothetical protein
VCEVRGEGLPRVGEGLCLQLHRGGGGAGQALAQNGGRGGRRGAARGHRVHQGRGCGQAAGEVGEGSQSTQGWCWAGQALAENGGRRPRRPASGGQSTPGGAGQRDWSSDGGSEALTKTPQSEK